MICDRLNLADDARANTSRRTWLALALDELQQADGDEDGWNDPEPPARALLTVRTAAHGSLA